MHLKEICVYVSPPSYEDLAKEFIRLSQAKFAAFTSQRFPNQELFLSLDRSVLDQNCIIFGSIAPPDINLINFLMLCHTLKKEKAKKVTGIVPYLAYTRQEKEETKKSQMTALVAALLKEAGLDELMTVDIHSPNSQQLFAFPVRSLSPAKLFADEIRQLLWSEVTFVAPDKGAIARCQAVANEVCSHNLVWIEKRRFQESVLHQDLKSEVKERAIIVDDILDTGKTLISCTKKLREKEVKEIMIMVTHGLFTGNEWKQLFDLGVTRIYCTDSIPLNKNLQQEQRIRVIPIAPLLSNAWT